MILPKLVMCIILIPETGLNLESVINLWDNVYAFVIDPRKRQRIFYITI